MFTFRASTSRTEPRPKRYGRFTFRLPKYLAKIFFFSNESSQLPYCAVSVSTVELGAIIINVITFAYKSRVPRAKHTTHGLGSVFAGEISRTLQYGEEFCCVC